MKFYVKYGCSECHETLIVEAESFERADEFAEGAAQDVYYSYDCNYPSDEDYAYYEEEGMTEDEISEGEYMDMISGIDWVVEPYDESNEDHAEAMEEQGGVPFEV
jgi:hypothetical protein